MTWRGGAAAVAVLTFDVDAESPVLARGRRYAGDASAMSHQAFGPLVGVPRILRLLDDLAVPATFFVPGVVAERYPDVVLAVLEAGHEVAHHTYAHRPATAMSLDEQRRDFDRALRVLEGLGAAPQGHRAAGWQATWHTPELVAEFGLAYDSSLMDDDSPYLLATSRGPVAELPVHWGLDDWEQYAFLPEPDVGRVIEAPQKVLSMWTAELDAAARYGSCFVLTCHPFLSGRPARAEALRALIEHGLARGDVGFLAAGEVARRVLADGGPPRPLRPVEADPEVYP